MAIGGYLVRWCVVGSLIGLLGGSASAVFLLSLDWATQTRLDHPWLLYLLPLGGAAIALLYRFAGSGCEAGNNLILESIHNHKVRVPARLAPVILIATVATHLFGGSAGREGTAVQMGGSLAAWIGRKLALTPHLTRISLMAGISAGFGAVFGTPLAGMIFGLEVLAVGRLRYDALLPCLVASLIGDWTCAGLGVVHSTYAIASTPVFDAVTIVKILIAIPIFGIVSVVFSECTHGVKTAVDQLVPWTSARPVLGGAIVILLVWLLGTRDYLGLGLPTIAACFQPEGVVLAAFAWKLAFTAITLGTGFKGGEVTPLFFIGAALGCTLGRLLGLPTDFMAALGFVAVFAAAANTPLACTLMAIELFGHQYAVWFALACCGSYLCSTHRGIYPAQRVAVSKWKAESHE